ncbi:unnamed protein product [Parascedosporium putredinis]|uniref:PLU-1-like protein n=1 Tax=Parascedosporium putredinis TaxID=1442378 RepID=A0A9P1H180_9PEZI|nr:unnamed protein product [Parascedosporium putredinis]CAI7994887.1 unnamed protein product [Parascedosporium putredinis]
MASAKSSPRVKFHFRTRKQELNSVEGSTRANLTYTDALYKFHKQQGNNPSRVPYVDKKPLDLYRLKKAVEARGGFDKVCKHKKWAEIGRDLGYSGKIMSSLSTSLKTRTRSGSARTRNTYASQNPVCITNLSSTRQASDALQASLNGVKKETDGDSSMSNGVELDDGDNGSRRSKRLKKEAVPTVAGSHMSQFRPSCGKHEEAGVLLTCESCDHSYHGTCLDPPAKQKQPDSGWNCPRCLVGDGQFGFEEGGLYSLRQFQQKAADFKAGYFEKKIPFDSSANGPKPVTEEDVEREFWRLVTDIEETVEVEYGADIHCTTHGSGFPTLEKHPKNPYSLDPWNLNLLPLHPESLFRHIKSDISGMTVPWVYVGMIFSTFCWHNEDHYSYSANYQHFGDTKTWYGIPGEDAERFEAAMKEATAKWLAPALDRVHARERAHREAFLAKHGEARAQAGGGSKAPALLERVVNDEDVPEEEYQCSYCKAFTYLSRFKCHKTGRVLCLLHAGSHACCDASENARFVGADHARTPEAWEEKYEKLLDEEAVPSLKTLKALLHEGEKYRSSFPRSHSCNRRKNDKAWQSSKRKSIGGGSPEQKDRDRDVSNIYRLLQEAEQIGFDCSEILQLQERADAIEQFQKNAQRALEHVQSQGIQEIEDLLEEGRNYNVDIKEKLIEEGKRLEIPPYNDYLTYYNEQMLAGQQWEKKARELIAAEIIHYPQLEALSTQVQMNALPVTEQTLLRVDQILLKQRDAHRQIIDLTQRSRNPDFRQRPKYNEVCDIMKRLEELNSKPSGTSDLEREQKRHEDWMRQGKKLFGKSNAPLHILKSHLDYVLGRNLDCFDIVHDKPRDPAEPASREPSPATKQKHWEDPNREVFCLCRRVEAGMMIECGICHEWYHGKCLKIARGKVKDDDKAPWTCPICDHRVRIPRDAARPKLEDLMVWFDEIPNLPFQPEEEEVLQKIIDNAQAFRDHIRPYINPVLSSQAEAETQRFYLRKLEGSEESKSTRKPRPTKLQKLMAQHGVEDPDDLPEDVKGKANSLRRKARYYASREGAKGESKGDLMNIDGVDDEGLTLEDRLLRGQLDGLNLHSDAVKSKALEIFRHSEVGRRQAQEIYGADVWRRESGGFSSSVSAGQATEHHDPREVDKMFVDLTNQEDEERKNRVAPAETRVTADSLENERNGMDALLDGE